MNEPDYETFVRDTILRHITGDRCDHSKLGRACAFYGVDLKKFKEEHSDKIVFAMLKR